MKKMCTIMLALLLVLTSFNGTALAANPVQPPERDFRWQDNGDGTVTITDYTGSAKDIIIPNRLGGKPVTVIGNWAFEDNQLTSVEIPSSVTTIGTWAFKNNQLKSVVIPSSVKTIGSSAFADNQLTSVTIPDSVTYISSSSFRYNKLKDVTIKNATATIGSNAFADNQENPSDLTIYGHSPSTAEDHANQNGYTFVDLRAPATFSADMTEPTNQNVTVTINYPANAAVKQYKINSGSWQNYTGPVVMMDNGTIYARSQSADGIWSKESSYTVSNIDRVPPDPPTITPDTTSPTTDIVTLTIYYPADATIKEYKIGQEGDWHLYTEPVPVASNTIVYARATDAAGNTSVSQYEVKNIITFKPATPDINFDGNTVTITTTDNPDTVILYYRVNGGDWEEYSGPFTLPAGTYTIEAKAKAVDENGVESDTSFIENVNITEPTNPAGPDEDQGEPPNGDDSGNGDGSGNGDESDEGSQDSDPATITLPAGFHKYKKTVYILLPSPLKDKNVKELVPANYRDIADRWN